MGYKIMDKNIEVITNKTSKDKQHSYAYLNKKYNKAYKEGFYFEAIMIAYNLVEDRLIALLHYAGVVNRDTFKDNKSIKITKRTRPIIRQLMGKDDKSQIRVSNIGTKISILRNLTNSRFDDEYIRTVREQIEKKIGLDDFMSILERCDIWKDYRNKYVHGLANKNPESVEEYACSVADEGYILSRELDNMVGRFSRGNLIRKRFRIQ